MYYLLILLILLLHYHWAKNNKSNAVKLENRYVIFICIILVLMAAFRSNEVGADTISYRMNYENLPYYKSFGNLVDRFTINYIGYYGLSKIFHLMGLPVQVWFGFIEAFYLYALMKMVNRFSKDKIFSVLVFVTIGLFTFSLAGLKQTLAASIMMLSFLFFTEKKYIYSALFVVATYFTHQAALIMLIAYPAYLLRNSKYLVPFSLISFVLLYFYGTLFIESMADVIDNEHFQDYVVNESRYTYVTFIFYTTITAICYSYFKNYKKQCRDNSRFIMSMSMLGCSLQLLAGFSPSLFRLALMFTPFMMVLIPNTIYYSNSSNKKSLTYILWGCIIFYFLYTNRAAPYSFL